MSQDNVSKIKERLGIKEVVESYIKLEKAGSNYKARCPFHNEKTPSFFISPERDSYYCFGCGAKGDIFTFIQEFEGTDFMGAMKILADKAGIILDKNSYKKNPQIEKVKEILEQATDYYQESFKKNGEVALYLNNRGLKEKTISEWRIGFAPSGWKNLSVYLKSKDFKEEDIEKAGLIKKGDRGDYYDRFRSRIMFPINNSSGEVIAFSGRIFGSEDDTAKYINSPETEIFKKSNVLYGFDKAKTAIRKNNFSILVEGQMDTIMCHQANYKNTVASSGTAITSSQLQNLNKISNNIVIAYDSDEAGFKASERAWKEALSLGMDVKVAPIEKGMDPADLIEKDIKKWKKAIKDSRHIIDLLIDRISEKELSERQKTQLIVKEVIPYLVSIKSSADRYHFIRKVSDKFSLPEEVIKEEIISFEKRDNLEDGGQDYVYRKPANTRERDSMSLEKRLFGLMYYFEKKDTNKFVEIQEGIISVVGQAEYDKILESLDKKLEEIVFAVENSFDQDELEKESTELLKNLKLKKLNKDRRRLLLKLKSAEDDSDEETQNEILNKINIISKQIQDIG